MSRYDDDWSRDSHRIGRHWTAVGESRRRGTAERGPRGSYLLTLALLVTFSTLGVVTINLLGYSLM
jgi:hypothetical protein